MTTSDIEEQAGPRGPYFRANWSIMLDDNDEIIGGKLRMSLVLPRELATETMVSKDVMCDSLADVKDETEKKTKRALLDALISEAERMKEAIK